MKSIESRKAARAASRAEAEKVQDTMSMLQVQHETQSTAGEPAGTELRNPPIQVPPVAAAVDTPAQRARAGKAVVEALESGALTVGTAAVDTKPAKAAKEPAKPANTPVWQANK